MALLDGQRMNAKGEVVEYDSSSGLWLPIGTGPSGVPTYVPTIGELVAYSENATGVTTAFGSGSSAVIPGTFITIPGGLNRPVQIEYECSITNTGSTAGAAGYYDVFLLEVTNGGSAQRDSAAFYMTTSTAQNLVSLAKLTGEYVMDVSSYDRSFALYLQVFSTTGTAAGVATNGTNLGKSIIKAMIV